MALDVAGGYAAPDFARRDSGALLDEGMIVDGAGADADVVDILDIGAVADMMGAISPRTTALNHTKHSSPKATSPT